VDRLHDIVAVGLLAVAVVACGSLAPDGGTEVASGTIDGAAWAARAGLTGQGVCLEVHVEGVAENNRICGLSEGDSGVSLFDLGAGTFVTGSRSDPRAATVRVTLADGTVSAAAVTGAGTATSLRFFVVALPRGTVPDLVETIDAEGGVINTIQLDR
jgi:hypothetical protein